MVNFRSSFFPFFSRWLILLSACLLAWAWTTSQSRAWFDAVANWDNIYIAAVNDYATVPTYHAAEDNYVVSGAGTTAINGTYAVAGTMEGKPYYISGSNTLFWSASFGGLWGLSSGAGEYYIFSLASTPPLIGWQVDNGAAPAPTLAEGGPYVTAPDGGTVSQNVTFRVALRPISPATITTTKIQYKKVSDGLWYDLDPTYSSPTWPIDFFATQTAFGEDRSTVTQYAAGAAARFRIYATDGLVENADPAVDTTEDGTNGWADAWVVGCTLHATNSKPPAPTEDN